MLLFLGKLGRIGQYILFYLCLDGQLGRPNVFAETISSETALSWVRLDSDVIEDVKNGRLKLALPQARAWEVCLPSKNWGNDRTTGQESYS